jgi:pimeloyl-ACP methyl ester carboxylesterase
MYGELLTYRTDDGIRMTGLLYRSGTRNKTAIINVFGMTGDFFSSPRYEAMAKAAKSTDIDIFFAGNRGIGLSFPFKDRNGKKILLGTAHERFEDSIFDIRAAVRLLHNRSYKKIILMGHSTGCQKSVYYLYRTGNRRITGLILLGPAGDYDLVKKMLGKRLGKAVMVARDMIKKRKNKEMTPAWISNYTPRRFLSYAVAGSPEARMFNYNSSLREFGSIRCPIFVCFGENEQYATKPVKEHISILRHATGSRKFESAIIKGADHSFTGKEAALAKEVVGWARRIAD